VEPGETTYSEAVALLHAHPLTHQYAAGRNQGVFNGDGVTALIFVDSRDVVVRIDRLRTTVNIPGGPDGVLGEVVAAFGTPDLAPWHGFGSAVRYWYKAPILGDICAIAHCHH